MKKIVPLVFLFACGEPPVENSGPQTQVSGVVRDTGGGQAQRQFGGMGTIAATTKVKARVPSANGTLQTLSETTIDATGKFTISVGQTREKIVLQAVDANDNVKAQAILDSARGAAEVGKTTAPPLDVESSVEAEVFVALLKLNQPIDQINTIDLRARITAKLAAAVAAHADKAARVRVLAEAVQVAQKSEIKSYADAGVTVTTKDLFAAQLAAAENLNVALVAGTDDAAAYETFFTGLDVVAETKGYKGVKRVRGQSAASAAFRTTVKVRVNVAGDAVTEAAQAAGASLEARALALGVNAMLVAGAGGETAIAQAATAGTTLRAEVKAAANVAECGLAFAKYQAAIRGSGTVNNTTILGAALGAESVLNGPGALQLSLDVVVGAANVLDGAVTALVAATGVVDYDAAAATVVGAYITFNAAATAQHINFLGFGNKAQLGVDLLLVSEGAYRLRIN